MGTAPSIRESLRVLGTGETTSRALTESVLEEIDAENGSLNAFLTVCGDHALAQADAADRARTAGNPGPLCGVPIALKDVLVTRGVRTTAGSRILENFVPPYDGTVVRKLREAGAVFVGKTNQDEFAMGSSGENSAFGATQNPAVPGCIPGGSSSGSAAAVAARLCAGAIGTDTGGSIRQPASMTGTVGLKPTYGRVSRFGVVAFASSLDQVGPMGRSVWDVAQMLEVIAGHDARDSTSADRPVDRYVAAAERGAGGVEGLRIGVPEEYFVDGMQPAVDTAVRRAIQALESAGATVTRISLPHTRYAVATYYLVATAEASSNLARYDGVRYGHRAAEVADLDDLYRRSRSEGFGPEVKRRIMLGTYALSAGYYDAYYGRAQKVRTLIRRDFEEAFRSVDIIATPTTPTVAFPLGERMDNPLQMYLADIFTISCNLAGLPGMSLPCGTDADGAPIGLQLLAPWFQEGSLCAAGAWHESLRGESV
jgi:aspartyl-tRNA(Asn)/glutamyl-tRNA(Gln) amidotransferase subunit A